MGRYWNWQQVRAGRGTTGFNEACKWVRAEFWPQEGNWFRDDSIRIQSACYKFEDEPIGSTLMEEIRNGFEVTAEIAGYCEDIIESGVNSAEGVIGVYEQLRGTSVPRRR